MWNSSFFLQDFGFNFLISMFWGFSPSRSHMPLSPTADTKHDRPRQQAVTNGNPTGSAVARDDDADDSPPGNSVVVRIGIPDLQQTVTHSQNGSGIRTTEMKPTTRHKPVCVSVCACLFLCPPVCLPAFSLAPPLSEVFAAGPRVASLDQ